MRPSLPAPPAAATDEPDRPHILVEGERGRAALLAWAAANLPSGEALVAVRDLVGVRRAFHTRPLDPRAELVAREAPLVLRGSLTALVSYWRVPLDNLRAREVHTENGAYSHEYDTTLRVACRGTRASSPSPREVPA